MCGKLGGCMRISPVCINERKGIRQNLRNFGIPQSSVNTVNKKEVMSLNSANLLASNVIAHNNMSKPVSFGREKIELNPKDTCISLGKLINVDMMREYKSYCKDTRSIDELESDTYYEYNLCYKPQYGPLFEHYHRGYVYVDKDKNTYFLSKNEYRKICIDKEVKEHKDVTSLLATGYYSFEEIALSLAENDRFDEALKKYNDNPQKYDKKSLIPGFVKADRIEEAVKFTPENATEIVKECINQDKFEVALKMLKENSEIKSSYNKQNYPTNKIIYYLTMGDRDDEALELFPDSKCNIIAANLWQNKLEQALNLFDTASYEELKRIQIVAENMAPVAKHFKNNENNEIMYCYGVKNKMIKYLVSQGREEEACARFNYVRRGEKELQDELKTVQDKDDMESVITQFFSVKGKEEKKATYGLKEEDIKFALDFINKYVDLEEYKAKVKEDAVKSAEGFLDRDFFLDRVVKDIFTLGLAEIANLYSRNEKKFKNLDKANEDINNKQQAISIILALYLQNDDRILKVSNMISENMQVLESKKEPVKQTLQGRFLNPLNDWFKNEHVKLPNCIMLTGTCPDTMKELIDWTGEFASKRNTDYVKLPSLPNKDEMYDSILESLEKAEENYQKTKRRSLIFVNGMDKLLFEDSNTQSEIADMKDIMDKANRYYHSTIIFYSKNPEKLDPGTTVSHRIGLKVDVPFENNTELTKGITDLIVKK